MNAETRGEALLCQALPFLRGYADRLKISKKKKPAKQRMINDLINEILCFRTEEQSEDKIPYYACLDRARKVCFGEFEKENKELRELVKELNEVARMVNAVDVAKSAHDYLRSIAATAHNQANQFLKEPRQ